MDTLLQVENVVKHFPIPTGGLVQRRYAMCKAVDGISFSVARGACFGIAGESGSGKSTVAKLLLRLEQATSGTVLFEGKSIGNLDRRGSQWYRSRVQTVFQDAGSSLNPRMRVHELVSEPLEVQRKDMSRQAIRDKTAEILQRVGLGSIYLRRYPHELSGGQRQRVAIARAIILEPSLVILDEPVSALDVSVRAQVLNLLADIRERQALTYIIIAHDIAMLQNITTDIAVMYLGKIVEIGKTEQVFGSPQHPYTKALFEAVPQPIPGRIKQTSALSGEIGNSINPPNGCRFHPRCSIASPRCREQDPPLSAIGPGHYLACYISGR